MTIKMEDQQTELEFLRKNFQDEVKGKCYIFKVSKGVFDLLS